jgi:hypothetical protein
MLQAQRGRNGDSRSCPIVFLVICWLWTKPSSSSGREDLTHHQKKTLSLPAHVRYLQASCESESKLPSCGAFFSHGRIQELHIVAALPPRRGARCRHDQRSLCYILLLVRATGMAQDRIDSAQPRGCQGFASASQTRRVDRTEQGGS